MAHDTGIIASFTDEANGVRADVIRPHYAGGVYTVLIVDTDADLEFGRTSRRALKDAIRYALVSVADGYPVSLETLNTEIYGAAQALAPDALLDVLADWPLLS